MASPGPLRVIDFGRVSPLRSQTLWHALARGVGEGAPATLAFQRPTGPYVSIGYHRRLAELDMARCRAAGLPVFRRMVGGGPVYIDDGQLFFQIVLPAQGLSAARGRLMRRLLEPAVSAFQEVGIPAELDEHNEIVVGEAKICGTGAGQIGDAVIVVGNLIERFDHAACADTLHVPIPEARAELVRLMRRYVLATPADEDRFRTAARRSYADALGLEAVTGELTPAEVDHLADLDARFQDPDWVAGSDRPSAALWRVKVRAGVWMFSASEGDTRATASVQAGRISWSRLDDPGLGEARRVEASVAGATVVDARGALSALGAPGQRLGSLLALAERPAP